MEDADRGEHGQDTALLFLEGMAIKEINRKLNISRNTVRKVIRSGALEHRDERERRSLPALGEYVERLTLRELKLHSMVGAFEETVP